MPYLRLIDSVTHDVTEVSDPVARLGRVAEELLPAGRLEYGLSAGSCRGTPCGATANVDLHYGVSDRWTLRGGVDRFWRDTLPDLTHAYASLVGSPSTTWTVTLDGVTAGLARAGLRYEPSSDRRGTAEYTR